MFYAICVTDDIEIIIIACLCVYSYHTLHHNKAVVSVLVLLGSVINFSYTELYARFHSFVDIGHCNNLSQRNLKFRRTDFSVNVAQVNRRDAKCCLNHQLILRKRTVFIVQVRIHTQNSVGRRTPVRDFQAFFHANLVRYSADRFIRNKVFV